MKVQKRKSTMPESRAWTEVEDFFLSNNLGKMSAGELAGKLGRPVGEVSYRIKELNLGGRAAEVRKAAGMKGFDVHPSGAVSMTADKSHADDRQAGTVPDSVVEQAKEARKKAGLPPAEDPQPNPRNDAFHAKYAKDVGKIWG